MTELRRQGRPWKNNTHSLTGNTPYPDDATPEERLLIEEARKAAQGAYAPFSGYRVGAAAGWRADG